MQSDKPFTQNPPCPSSFQSPEFLSSERLSSYSDNPDLYSLTEIHKTIFFPHNPCETDFWTLEALLITTSLICLGISANVYVPEKSCRV